MIYLIIDKDNNIHGWTRDEDFAHRCCGQGERVEGWCADEVAKYYGTGAGSIALRNMPRLYGEGDG